MGKDKNQIKKLAKGKSPWSNGDEDIRIWHVVIVVLILMTTLLLTSSCSLYDLGATVDRTYHTIRGEHVLKDSFEKDTHYIKAKRMKSPEKKYCYELKTMSGIIEICEDNQ